LNTKKRSSENGPEGKLGTLGFLRDNENCFMFPKLKDITFFHAAEEAKGRKGGRPLPVSAYFFAFLFHQ